ncbi:hypothetical protein HHK36_009703 [Tetracentron sinense]|uniref:SCP domain-containing protein n=1 Tax=Tetracentron sinense TaxID=13715 RepID=A0A834ZGM1_TETSI|nr:hypothetical protein HHK36_009703 [Tetracentron sinense]
MELSRLLLLVLALTFAMALTLCHVSLAQNRPQDFLDLHNAAREEVGVRRPLTWDPSLEEYAKKYAEVRSNDCQLIHSGGPYGENIYWGYGTDGYTDAEGAIKYWVDEKKYYNYESNSCMRGKECLHYTQIVWSNSVHLGCARTKCTNDHFFITCNYNPPGNFEGERPY